VAPVARIQLVHAPGKAGDKLRLRSWIEIQLVGEDDSPVPDVRYALRLPGGKVVEGTLDANGSARVEGIPAGSCEVSFPDLDQDAWVPV
jgi:hypothetical protein